MVSTSEVEEYFELIKKRKEIPDSKKKTEDWIRQKKDKEETLKRTRARLEKWKTE